jgi:biotin carboxyl carrier protein
MTYVAQIDDQSFDVVLSENGQVTVNGEKFHCDVQRGSRPEHFSLIIEGRSHQIWMEPINGEMRVHIGGFDFNVRVEDERVHRLRQLAAQEAPSHEKGMIAAPMPGLVVKILIEPGQPVRKGQGILIVEAMKMENEIRAPISGVVKEIKVQLRQAVEKGEILAVIED